MNTYAGQESDARQEILPEVTKLLEKNDYARAYQILKPYVQTYAGDVGFDYTFGLAALHAGKPNEAVDYLARVVDVFPNHIMARFQLGLAYMALNDKQNAKSQFEYLKSLNLPEPVNQNTNKYLAQIESSEQSNSSLYPSNITTYIDAGFGHDSNANSAVTQSAIAVPAIGSIINLPAESRATKSNYYSTNLGVSLTKPLSYDWLLYAGSDVRYRDYDIDNFTNTFTTARAGLIKLFGNHFVKFGGNGSYTDFNSRSNHSLGADAEYRYVFDEFNQLYSYTNFTSYRFSKSFENQDFDQSSLGMGFTHLSEQKNKSISLGALLGHENDVAGITSQNPNGGRIDGNQNYYGAVMSGYYSPTASWKINGSVFYQHGDYSEQNILFLRNRADKRLFITLGADYQLTSNWGLRVNMQHIAVNSNIDIYDFDRNDMNLSLRYEFK